MSIEDHAAFFARLVEMVPPKFYLHTDAGRVNLKYVKKSVRDEAKAAFKAQYKENKKAQLDPDQAKSTLDLQREVAAAAAAEQRASGRGNEAGPAPTTPVVVGEPAATASRQPAEGTAAPVATLVLTQGGAWRCRDLGLQGVVMPYRPRHLFAWQVVLKGRGIGRGTGLKQGQAHLSPLHLR